MRTPVASKIALAIAAASGGSTVHPALTVRFPDDRSARFDLLGALMSRIG
jgi:hypothetical protein